MELDVNQQKALKFHRIYLRYHSMFKLLFITEALILNNLLLINSKKLYGL